VKNTMADVRPSVGVPDITAFNNDLGTPIVVDSNTGNLYVLVGSTVTKVGVPASGTTWTPTDASGAGLSLTVSAATYKSSNGFVTIHSAITYPVTASGANAIIGGAPFTAAQSSVTGAYTTAAVAITAGIAIATTNISLFAAAGGAAITNLQMSGKIIEFTISYEV
jgi:hypothetical protein